MASAFAISQNHAWYSELKMHFVTYLKRSRPIGAACVGFVRGRAARHGGKAARHGGRVARQGGKAARQGGWAAGQGGILNVRSRTRGRSE